LQPSRWHGLRFGFTRLIESQRSTPLSLPNHLDQHPLAPSPVKLAIKDLLPRPEIQLAIRDRDNDLTAHDLALQMCVGVVFAGAVVLVLASRRVRGELFEPELVVVVQA